MKGIPILGCLPGSPAEEAGLKLGDTLLSVNGEPMRSIADFLRVRSVASRRLELLVQRANRLMELTLELAEAEASTAEELLAPLDGPLARLALLSPHGGTESMN